jgi:site-specific recombinase XerD
LTQIYLVDGQASNRSERLLGDFIAHLKSTDRQKSVKPYLNSIRKFVRWFEKNRGPFQAEAISPLDVTDFREYLQQKKQAPATINHALTSLRVFYKWLLKTNQVADNPVEDIKPVAETKHAPKWLNRNEQAALIRAIRAEGNQRDEAMVITLLHAGLRISELCSLEREDIVINQRSGNLTVQGKGNKTRIVPLNITARKALERWLEENPSGPLFPNRYGSPISTTGVYKIIAKYAYQARIEKNVSPHTLRHTFCKNLVDKNTSLDQIAVLAGHSSLDTTKQYTVPSLGDLQRVVDRVAWE